MISVSVEKAMKAKTFIFFNVIDVHFETFATSKYGSHGLKHFLVIYFFLKFLQITKG